jgi:hypothetical protein
LTGPGAPAHSFLQTFAAKELNLTTRYAIVGTGSRAAMFVRALTAEHRDTCELVALADPNPVRIAVHNARLPAPVPAYPPTRPPASPP